MSQRYIGGLIYNPPGGFSGYFDGSGDFLTWTGTAAGSGAFCYEFWIFSQNGFGTMRAPLGVIAISGYNSALDIRMTGSTINVSQYNVANNNFTVDSLQANTWYHIAVCRNASNQTTVFVNGVRSSTGAVTIATNFSGLTSAIGRLDPSNGGDVTGYISNVRLITGSTPYDPTQTTITVPSGPLQAITGTQFLSCAYPTFRDGSTNNFTITRNGNTAVSVQNPFPLTALPNPNLGNQGNGVYTMSQYQALRSQNLWPAIDPYWEYVTLMLHGNGTNGAQNNTFLDSSTNNFTITRNGNTTQGTFTPYGSNWSNYFDGATDYLITPSNAALDFGTGDFTIEAWVYRTSSTGGTPIVSNSDDFSINNNYFLLAYDGVAYFEIRTSGGSTSTTGTINGGLNTWVHLAVSRQSGTVRLFVNGALDKTITMSAACTQRSVVIGGFLYGAGFAAYFPGYISNARLIKGTAVYTAAFTPPTAPLTAITNTSLLTCQSNRFIDNSSNNFALTRNGDVSVQRFSPFHPTAPYAAGTIGGSGYFDGSGDYLTAPSGAAFAFGTGDFTIEAWIYCTNFSGVENFIFDSRSSVSTAGMGFNIEPTTGKLRYSGNANNVLTSTSITANAWTHVAWVRSGSTLTGYINGVSGGSVTNTDNLTQNIGAVGVVGFSASGYFNGYMSNVRVVKGTAVYTGAFTPPSAPLTAITNTSLLLNFTNGGIIDNAMMNDLETVGNAQISTSVSKFGGGSMSFVRSPSSYLVANNATGLLSLGTSNWTIEAWVYMNTLPAGNGYPDSYWVVGGGPVNNNTGFDIAIGSTNLQIGLTSFASLNINTAHGMSATTWYHIAVVRSGSTLYAFINGNQLATASVSGVTVDPCLTGLAISAAEPTGATSGNFNGYIDDLRITKGYARYTANFTPQRSQWQDQ